MEKRLVLFDIDNTLLRCESHSSRFADPKSDIFSKAINCVFSISNVNFESSVVSGLTDWIIAENALQCHKPDITISKKNWIKIVSLAEQLLFDWRQRNPQCTLFEVLPGVTELLSVLTEQGIKIGIVTGNITCFAEFKLAQVGISTAIDYWSCADESKTRPEILSNALHSIPNVNYVTNTVFIGDTVHDWNAASENGIRFIGVGTPPKDPALQMILQRGDVLWLNDLTDTNRICNYIRGHV